MSTYFAAGRQREHERFSFTHWAMGTGTLGHGEMSSLTYVLHSFFSRGVSALVSTPSRVTSAAWVVVAPGLSLVTSPLDFWQVEAWVVTKRPAASRVAVRMPISARSLEPFSSGCYRQRAVVCARRV